MMPESEPEESKGTSEVKWIMGDRYLQHLVQGISMGHPFEGMGLTGLDNGKTKYQKLWIDNMGTGIMIGEGTYDPGKRTLSDEGSFTDPMVGQRTYRGVITFINNDNYKYDEYTADQTGKEFRMIEISYSRAS